VAEPRKAFGGRFLRRRLCDSPTVAAFVKEYGPWAGMFFDRLITNSDDDGRFLAEVAGAKCFPHHPRAAARALRFLAGMDRYGFIVLYEGEVGSRYGAWRKWRKHQPKPRADRYIPSELPAPPAGTTDVRSGGRTGLRSGAPSDIPSGATEEEEEYEEEVEEEGAGAKAAGCPFCARPTKGPLQHYHDEAKRVLERCLVIDPAACGALIARREKALGRDRCHVLFAAYLASEDPFVAKSGHSLKLFCSESMINGLGAALDGGYTHGRSATGRRKANPTGW